MPDETAGAPNPAATSSEDALPYPDEVLFAPPQRAVLPRPIYRHRWIKGLYARGVWLSRQWSIGRFVVGLFCVFAFGLIGVAVADAFFCPGGTAARFWQGCMWETIGFGSGGGLLGLAFFVLALRTFDRRPSPAPDPATDTDPSQDTPSQPLEDQ